MTKRLTLGALLVVMAALAVHDLVGIAQGRVTPELRTALNDPIVRAAHVYENVMLIAITALMTLKPF